VRTFRAPGRVNDLAFSPDGRLLAVACEGEVLFLDAATAEPAGEPLPLNAAATSRAVR